MLIRFLENTILQREKKRGIGEALLIDLSAILLWRGSWTLLDMFLFPDNSVVSAVISITLGLILMLTISWRSRR